MSAFDILRRLTKPMTDAESEAVVRARYGRTRENVSSDDPMAVKRAGDLVNRQVDQGKAAGTAQRVAIKIKAAGTGDSSSKSGKKLKFGG